MTAATTAGLLLGTIILAIGLVLVLLPQDFSGQGTISTPDYEPNGNGGAGSEMLGSIQIAVISADLSFGGASLNVNFNTGGVLVNASLYTSTAGAAVWAKSPGNALSIASLTDVSTGDLVDNGAIPGDQYYAIFVVPGNSTPTIQVTWNGAVDFPYAYLGVPLVIAGAVVMIAVVSVLPPRSDAPDQQGSGVAMQEAYVYESPPVILEGPPSSSAPPPSPSLASLPSPSSSQSAPNPDAYPPPSSPAPQFAARPAPVRKGPWRAIPLRRSVDSDSSPARSPLARAPLQTAASPSIRPTEPAAASAPPSADAGTKCPRCRLAIGDGSWAFCPRCRTELG